MREIVTASEPPFCIDETEVTQAQYAEFLSSGPSLADQLGECRGDAGGIVEGGIVFANNSYAPSCSTPSAYYNPTARPSHPVACVDWCDAVAFCQWANKRLCKPPGTPTDDPPVAAGEWYIACSRGGTQLYPFGNDPDAGGCSFDADGGPTRVGTSTCQGGFEGIYDMVGNVAEWIATCNRGGFGRVAGADFSNPQKHVECDYPHGEGRNVANVNIGIRCCADANP